MAEITYDHWGRMNYNPEFHTKAGTPWSTEDLKYLIDWYDIIGPEEMSLALERTMKTVQNKAAALRKKGIMKNPAKHIHHKRIRGEAVRCQI